MKITGSNMKSYYIKDIFQNCSRETIPLSSARRLHHGEELRVVDETVLVNVRLLYDLLKNKNIK
jgi:hypothetical protein